MAVDSLYAHPAFYRMLHHERRADLDFYLEAVADRSTVLEYGVGYGRVALALARRGQRVVGVDNAEPMLAALRAELEGEPAEVRPRVSVVHGDARSLSLAERFEAVTCPFNGIAHHRDADELAAFLARVREHLGPSGIFVFDVAVPNPTLLAGTSSDTPWFRDPVDGRVCRATETTTYDPLTQVLTITTVTRSMEDEHPPVTMQLRLRQLFPEETRLLLLHHGFVVERRETGLGDVIGYVCRAAASR